MSFRWNVQPYQYLSELRENYGQFVTSSTRNYARKIAPEAEQWMRDHAPWKDRPDDQRSEYEQSQGHAREGLRVIVLGDKDEQRAEKQGLAAAERMDKALIKRLETERIPKLDALLLEQRTLQRSLREAGLSTNLGFYPKMQAAKLRKPVTSLPASRSHVTEFKRLQAQRWPLVEVQFRHNLRLRYTIWLELAMGGRYSIIGPALDYWGPKLMNEVRRIANLKQYQQVGLVQDSTTRMADLVSEQETFMREMRAMEGDYRPHSEGFQLESLKRSGYYQRTKRRAGDNRRKYRK